MAHRAAGGAAMRHAALACIAAALTAPAGAHEPFGVSWLALDPWWLGLLAAAAGLYLRRLCVLWRRAGLGHGVSRTQALAFAAGWLAVALALLSPLDALAEQRFSLHMVQHALLMVLGAPLLVLGRPIAAWA